MVASGEVPRGERMLFSGTDPESHTTENTLQYTKIDFEKHVMAGYRPEMNGSDRHCASFFIHLSTRLTTEVSLHPEKSNRGEYLI